MPAVDDAAPKERSDQRGAADDSAAADDAAEELDVENRVEVTARGHQRPNMPCVDAKTSALAAVLASLQSLTHDEIRH